MALLLYLACFALVAGLLGEFKAQRHIVRAFKSIVHSEIDTKSLWGSRFSTICDAIEAFTGNYQFISLVPFVERYMSDPSVRTSGPILKKFLCLATT